MTAWFWIVAGLGCELLINPLPAPEYEELDADDPLGVVTLSPDVLDMGQVNVFDHVTQTVWAENLGTESALISEVSVSGPFEVGVLPTVVLEPDGGMTLEVVFRPLTPGPAEGVLQVITRGGVTELAVTGQGMGAELVYEPGEIDVT
jgi:hypothetical protein